MNLNFRGSILNLVTKNNQEILQFFKYQINIKNYIDIKLLHKQIEKKLI